MRKSTWTGLIAVMALIAAAVVGLLLPSSASAAPARGPVVAAASTGACSPYPPGTDAAFITVSASAVNPGEAITVTGKNFTPNARITLVLYPKSTPSDAITAASLNADSKGSFTTSITMPLNAVGNQILQVNGTFSGCPADPIQISVLGTPSSGSSTPGQPPAITGTDIGLMAAVAAVLLVAGGVFARSGRRRRAAHR